MTFLFVFIGVSLATTTTLSATKDTYLGSSVASTTAGTQPIFQVGEVGGQNTILVQFDTPGMIPAGESLVSISLELTVLFGNSQVAQMDVFALAQSWTEQDASTTTRDGMNSWSDPPVLQSPADFDASTITSTPLLPSSGSGAVLSWDVTSIVNAWQNGAPNNGFLVKTDATNAAPFIASRENPSINFRPRLVVESALPLLLPTVITITPTNGPASGGNDVDLSGSNLDSITNVFFGPNEAVIAAARTDSDITVQVPAGEGTVPIIVRTPDKKRDDTTVGSYTYDGSLFPSE